MSAAQGQPLQHSNSPSGLFRFPLTSSTPSVMSNSEPSFSAIAIASYDKSLHKTSDNNFITSAALPHNAQPFSVPAFVAANQSTWPNSFQELIDNALSRAWAPATIKNYTTGINKYLHFCQRHDIHRSLIFPANEYLLCAFTAHLAESLTRNTIKNILSGIRAWHIANGFDFHRSERLTILARSTVNTQSTPPRKPVTLDMLHILLDNLSHQNPKDCAVLACALLAFWGLARLGELLPIASTGSLSRLPNKQAFLPSVNDSFVLNLPWTKTKGWQGQQIIIGPQEKPFDPIHMMKLHLSLNFSVPSDTLFSFSSPTGPSTLDKQLFLSRCNSIWSLHGFSHTTGHSFRIGGATHLLSCGINPDIIRTHGRWTSDSFLRYWRNLSFIIPRHVRFATITPEPSQLGSRGCSSAAARPESLGERRPPAAQHRASKSRAEPYALRRLKHGPTFAEPSPTLG